MSKRRMTTVQPDRYPAMLASRAYFDNHPGEYGIGYLRMYAEAYMDAVMLLKGAEARMNVAWSRYVATVGLEYARIWFWDWQNTLPAGYKSDCDPDGN